MKKNYFLSFILIGIGLLVGAGQANAQSCDTLRNYTAAELINAGAYDLPDVLEESGQGYFPGNFELTEYGSDHAVGVAEHFNASGTQYINALNFFVLQSDDKNSGDLLEINIYGSGDVYSSGYQYPDESNVIGAYTFPIAALEDGWNNISLPAPLEVSGEFWVSFEWENSPFYDLTFATTAFNDRNDGTPTTSILFEYNGDYNGWWYLGEFLYNDEESLNSSLILDVLLSSGTAPTANFTLESNVICEGSTFQADASSSTGTIDSYYWGLVEFPFQDGADIYYEGPGSVNEVITPTTSSPSTQGVILIVNGACLSDMAFIPVTVNPEVSATITPTDASCVGNDGEIAVTNPVGGMGNYQYAINGGSPQMDGTFTDLAEGTYTVTVTTGGEGCVYTETVEIEGVEPHDPSFSYPSTTVCEGSGMQTPTIAENGGVFTAEPTGLAIDENTGVVDADNSNDGTYVVTYTFEGDCETSATFTLFITSSPDASFTYPEDTYCATGTATPNFENGASAGTFSSTTGLDIDATTGVIDLENSTPGTYIITNEISVEGCADDSQTFTIEVLPVTDATFSYTENSVCVGSADLSPNTNQTGGTFSATPAGLTIDPTTGVIDVANSDEGDYTITYAFAGDCGSSETFDLAITAEADASFSYDENNVCQGSADLVPTANQNGGTYSAETGLEIDASTGTIDVANSTPGTYTITYTIEGACGDTQTFELTINATPSVDAGSYDLLCEDDDIIQLNGTPAGGTFSGEGVSGNEFDPTIGEGSYPITYVYEDPTTGCEGSDVAIIIVEDCGGVGLADNGKVEMVSIAPNPATSHVEIVTSANILKVNLITLEGRYIATNVDVVNASTVKVDVSNISKGVYLLQINTENGAVSKKIVVE